MKVYIIRNENNIYGVYATKEIAEKKLKIANQPFYKGASEAALFGIEERKIEGINILK